MTGEDDELSWPRPRVETDARGDPGERGDPGGRGYGLRGFDGRGRDGHEVVQPGLRLRSPRWIVSIRALVVVLAMLAAALGMLWLEAANVQGVSADLSSTTGTHVTVPPLVDDAATPGAPTAEPTKTSGAQPGTPAATPIVPGASAGPVVAGAGENIASGDADGPDAGGGAISPGAGKSGDDNSDTEGVLVHVVGAVNNPGVFVLGEGSRIYQAVEAAGGAMPTAQLAALNMAAPVSDGMQIVVLTQEQAARPQDFPGVGAPADGEAAQTVPSGPLNINAATVAELDALPGIGPVLAQRIIAWRTDHGPFSSVDALDAVSGIGAKVLENLRSLVSVS